MKKIILTVSFILMLNISNLFAYYHAGNFIDFLVHSNQVRIRTDALGVLAGTRNIRVAASLTAANSLSDIIYDNIQNHNTTNAVNRFTPAALVGIGYDSDLFGIAAGYEFLYQSDAYMVHTPVITATALNDSFRINIPVSIGIGSKSKVQSINLSDTRVVSTAIEARYYFPKEIPALSHIRLFVNYGNAYIANVLNNKEYLEQSSFGLQARIHFKIETPEVLIEPIFRIQYDQALTTKDTVSDNYSKKVIVDNFDVTAKGFDGVYNTTGASADSGNGDPSIGSGFSGGYVASIPAGFYAERPYRLAIAVPVGFTATSADENIHFYLEPALSFTMISAKHIYESSFSKNERTTPFMSLGYVVYGELYIRPVKSLEWYMELQAGGTSRVAETMKNTWGNTQLVFNGSTGFHYYF
ncbi:cell surface protein [Brachyspira sp.]|uniref:cell surface protein n=1 Tax=Brachyspira sp. TaxID=1977261 RepID=UPI002617AC64|nr:cell surface protein [Brachyspira sp.]